MNSIYRRRAASDSDRSGAVGDEHSTISDPTRYKYRDRCRDRCRGSRQEHPTGSDDAS
jgi:hypothetical protein